MASLYACVETQSSIFIPWQALPPSWARHAHPAAMLESHATENSLRSLSVAEYMLLLSSIHMHTAGCRHCTDFCAARKASCGVLCCWAGCSTDQRQHSSQHNREASAAARSAAEAVRATAWSTDESAAALASSGQLPAAAAGCHSRTVLQGCITSTAAAAAWAAAPAAQAASTKHICSKQAAEAAAAVLQAGGPAGAGRPAAAAATEQ